MDSAAASDQEKLADAAAWFGGIKIAMRMLSVLPLLAHALLSWVASDDPESAMFTASFALFPLLLFAAMQAMAWWARALEREAVSRRTSSRRAIR